MDNSDIRGVGYGSTHNWKILGTKQLPYNAPKEEKCTTYQCRDCEEIFYHYYGNQADIFEAMEDAHVKEKCNKNTKLHQEFMNMIHTMIENKCEMPKEFELHYRITEFVDRHGHYLQIKPYLTREIALEETIPYGIGLVAYNGDKQYTKIVNTGRYKCKHKVDYDIELSS